MPCHSKDISAKACQGDGFFLPFCIVSKTDNFSTETPVVPMGIGLSLCDSDFFGRQKMGFATSGARYYGDGCIR